MIGQMFVLNRRLADHVEPGPRPMTFAAGSRPRCRSCWSRVFICCCPTPTCWCCSTSAPSEDVGIYYAVVKTLALVSFIHYAMSATTAHRFAEYHALGDKARLSAYVAHAIQWTFWPSLAATVLLLAFGKPLLWLFGPQFVVGYDIMFVAAIGLVVARRDRPGRAAAEHARPPERSARWPTRWPSS